MSLRRTHRVSANMLLTTFAFLDLLLTNELLTPGQDIVINVTVIKPRAEMSYEEMGLVVWNWPMLCVREIKKESIFVHTALQETDHIAAINDIDCSRMTEKGFAKCVKDLPTEITITVIRRKHRYTGSYR